jgi:ATP synthase protein I
MPEPHDARSKALSDFERKLEAMESQRAPKARFESARSFNEGYRLVASLIGGVLGGIGLGWLVDYFAGTGPWGLIGGLLIGSAASIYAAVRAAVRMSKTASESAPPQAVAFEDDE